MLAGIAVERGFEVFQDPIANLFVRRSGRSAGQPPFVIGSHLDTQPTGGRFDGALGTLAALEVLETLEDAGIETDTPVELVAWTNEEGCRFAPGSMGSQAFVSGAISADILASVSATDGAGLATELEATLSALPEASMRSLGGPLSGYLELHIEQGPILEREGVPIGVVNAVQGTRWLKVRISGQAGHAGTTPFDARRDPMMAAASGLSGLYAAIMPGDTEARMTVGRISAEPGSINAIPSAVVFTVDIRHPSLQRLEAIDARICATLGEAAAACGCSVGIERIFDMPPAEFAEPLLAAIEQAATEQGVRHRRIVSGAFHDALFVSRIAPAAMIFVPCRDGVSHNESEFVEPELSVLGGEILLKATLRAIAMLGRDAISLNAGAAGVVASNA
jgi:N-carbamoyl-L-amino-acid hydrolase